MLSLDSSFKKKFLGKITHLSLISFSGNINFLRYHWTLSFEYGYREVDLVGL